MVKLEKKDILEQSIKYHSNYNIIDVYRVPDIKSSNRPRIWVKANCNNGHSFSMLWDNYKRANCPECRRFEVSQNNKKYTIEQIEEQCKNKSLKWVNKDEIINGTKQDHNNIFILQCNICNHISKCNITNLFSDRQCGGCLNTQGKSQEGFEKDFYKKYSEDEYKVIGQYTNCKEDIEILHIPCGKTTMLTPDVLLAKESLICKVCYPAWLGEGKIIRWLEDNNITYNSQYYFRDLKGINNGYLKFDFAIFEDKSKTKLLCLIEYDGAFHYVQTLLGNDLEQQQEHDKIKDQYCLQHNIKLIRIPYWDFDNIEEILTNAILYIGGMSKGDKFIS
jgi:hypothetical protein